MSCIQNTALITLDLYSNVILLKISSIVHDYLDTPQGLVRQKASEVVRSLESRIAVFELLAYHSAPSCDLVVCTRHF